MNKVHDIELNSDTNYVHIVGKISKEVTPSHVFNSIMYYFLKVEVSHGNKKPDTIQAFIPETLILSDNKIIEIGDVIDLEGYLVYTKVKDRLDVSVIVNSIKIVDPSTERSNVMYLSGILYKSYEINSLSNNKVTKNIIIRHNFSDNDNKFFNIKAVAWNSLANKLDSDYKEGDNIIIKGKLKSREVTSSNGEVTSLHEALINIIINLSKDNE